MVRTSETDPLGIGEVTVRTGTIGLTFCPGKCGASVFGAPWSRDLKADVEVIRAWGADLVLTLIEDHEFDLLQVRGLGEAVRSAGMIWIHAPISDVDVPSKDFERRWGVIGHRVRNQILGGGRVLVHCRGGRGRAGLIAARLMVELGANASDAIDQVRRVRSGAIETRDQEAHVRKTKPITQHERKDKVLGCLFGGAVGDAFGYAIEFDRLARIRARYGSNGLTEQVLVNGKLVVSDDTQMTLFTAEALGETWDPERLIDACRAAYMRWYRTQTSRTDRDATAGLLAYDTLWANRAPGNTCLSALAAGGRGTIDKPTNNSKGCGGVMRTAPIGLVGYPVDEAFALGAQASALTHGHPSGYLSGGAMAAMISDIIGGLQIAEAALEAVVLARSRGGGEETARALETAMALAQRTDCDGRDVERGLMGEGWVGEEALAIALYACLVGRGFEDTIRIAANHDGDSDSTASIAGQLLGAMGGLGSVPWDWAEALDVFDAVCDMATKLVGRADTCCAIASKI